MPSLEIYDAAVRMTSTALKTIEDEQRWLGDKAFFGRRTPLGNLVRINFPSSEAPTCFCAIGALCAAADPVHMRMLDFYFLRIGRPAVATLAFEDTPEKKAFTLVLTAAMRLVPEVLSADAVYTYRRVRLLNSLQLLQLVNDDLGHKAVLAVLNRTLKTLQAERQAQAEQEAQAVPGLTGCPRVRLTSSNSGAILVG